MNNNEDIMQHQMLYINDFEHWDILCSYSLHINIPKYLNRMCRYATLKSFHNSPIALNTIYLNKTK